MRKLLTKFWRDESAVTSPEWAFIVTILVLGAVTGLIASRHRCRGFGLYFCEKKGESFGGFLEFWHGLFSLERGCQNP